MAKCCSLDGKGPQRTAAAAASSAAMPPPPRAAPPGIGTERDTVRPEAAPSGTCIGIVRAPAKRHRTSRARGVRRWRARSSRSRRCRSGPSTRNTICSCCRLSHLVRVRVRVRVGVGLRVRVGVRVRVRVQLLQAVAPLEGVLDAPG